jgi:fructuronate reductase
MVLAGWALQAGNMTPDADGVVTQDPLGRTVAELRERHDGSATDLAQAVLALPIWSPRLQADSGFSASVAKWVKTLACADPATCRAEIGAFSKERMNA